MASKSRETERQPKPESVHVIVNPAPSRRIPLLAILNQAFRDAGINWDISITHGAGDGAALARKAVEAGREAFLAGRMPKKLYSATPSSPTAGLITPGKPA